jgi:NAD(P)-dependent dehydrogenase (short-subunit alcohol dehydrogenase family)
MNGKSAIVAGARPDTGRFVVQRFSRGGYRVAIIRPHDIADAIWHVARQPSGAWSFNAELGPQGELW